MGIDSWFISTILVSIGNTLQSIRHDFQLIIQSQKNHILLEYVNNVYKYLCTRSFQTVW